MTYDLSEDELSRRFAGQILDALLANDPRPQPEPRLVLITGQPGAGKSFAERRLVADLNLDTPMVVDADDLRPFHPDYARLARADDRTADFLTHMAAQKWVVKALRQAISQRINVVFNTPGSTEAARWVSGLFRNAGYGVETAVVGVDHARSKLSILHRYQRGRDLSGSGRMVSSDYHDARYSGLLEMAERVEAERLANAIHVYNRNGDLLYHNAMDNGRWMRSPTASKAISAERDRRWTTAEARDFLSVAGWLARSPALDAVAQPHLLDEHRCNPLAQDLRPRLAEAVQLGAPRVRLANATQSAVSVAFPSEVTAMRRQETAQSRSRLHMPHGQPDVQISRSAER